MSTVTDIKKAKQRRLQKFMDQCFEQMCSEGERPDFIIKSWSACTPEERREAIRNGLEMESRSNDPEA